jgi:serine/threonine-protein kinase HipA
MSKSVENEWLCLRVLASFGLPVAAAEIARFGAQKALVVERFDRAWQDDGRWIARLPQEDFCQATGGPPGRKYESDGGPGMAKCLQLLEGSNEAEADRRRFLSTQFAFWLLAAIDGHAKNFSLFLTGGSGYRLTPLYDVLSAWPLVGDGAGLLPARRLKMAMAVRSKSAHWHVDKILPRHWVALADRHGLPELAGRMTRLAESAKAALAVVEEELPHDFPADVWEAVTGGVMKKATAFLEAVA